MGMFTFMFFSGQAEIMIRSLDEMIWYRYVEITTAWLLSDEELIELSQPAENFLRLKKNIKT